jgi:hypothetical protein
MARHTGAPALGPSALHTSCARPLLAVVRTPSGCAPAHGANPCRIAAHTPHAAAADFPSPSPSPTSQDAHSEVEPSAPSSQASAAG